MNRAAAPRRPTLREVAALAGVSLKTASRVVNGEPGVRADKVAAVEQAVGRLDYRPNVTASSLRRADGRTRAVAALLEDLANPYSAEVHRALEDVAREHGVLVFAGSVDEDPVRERELLRAFTARRADALLVVPATDHHGYLAQEITDGTPVVFVDRPPVGYAADAVLTDNVEGSGRAVHHLARHGHRRIGFLGDIRTIATARDRFEGFRAAAADLGLRVPADLVAHDLHDQETAAAAVRRMLALDEPPTAFFSGQNNITVAVVRTLQELDLSDRIALVGFDDFPLADLVRPGVTVMAQDPTEIGRRAAETLFARLAGDDAPARTLVVPTRLVERGSGEIRPA